LPKIIWHLDDPVADPALVPLYFVAKKAAEHVTVVLSGEGADEFFGGYTIYREPLSLAGVAGLPDPLQKGLRAVSKVIPQGVKGKSFLERGTTPIEERYYGNARMFTEEEKARLMRRYDPSVRYTDVTAPVYAEAEHLDDVTTMQYVDLYTWLRGDILVKADRMSMAHSLELRVPFLDKEVFEVAATVPVDLKLPPKTNETKFAMRRALEGVVPPAIVNRKKLGFPTPTRVWLRAEMYEWARDIFLRSGAGNLLDLDYAVQLLDEHRHGKADNSRKVWTVLVFCIWHAIFVERSLDPGITRNESALLTKPVVGSVVA
jgi:asparagine synthase (glutamine-hydrolysing)